jgi:hypothetical protein
MNDTTVWCQNASVTEPQRELLLPQQTHIAAQMQYDRALSLQDKFCKQIVKTRDLFFGFSLHSYQKMI